MKYFFVLIIVIFCLISVNCNNNDNMLTYEGVNQDLVSSIDFYVDSTTADLGTFAKGTIYICGNDDDQHIRATIVSWIEVDPQDWGGVVFNIPLGWQVANITSSYSDENTPDSPSQYIAKWETGDQESEWSQMVEIGTSHTNVPLSENGGRGSVIIELISKEKPSSNILNILVSVGSKIEDGVRILGAEYKVIEASLVSG